VSGARFSKARVEAIRDRALSNGEVDCYLRKSSYQAADFVGAMWSLAERLVGYERETGWLENEFEATLYRGFILDKIGHAQVAIAAEKQEIEAARDDLAAREAAKRKKVA
jgi:hypothetical protein